MKLAGWTQEQILAQPATWLDWMLAIEDANNEAQAAAAKRKQPRAARQPRTAQADMLPGF